jgi:hypothetical protein
MNAVALQIVEPVAGLPALVMRAASRLASAAGHNPETGGAPSFNNCRRAVVARRAALGDAQGMSLGPGAANNSVVAGGRRQTALRLVSRPRFVTHRQFDQPPSCQQVSAGPGLAERASEGLAPDGRGDRS